MKSIRLVVVSIFIGVIVGLAGFFSVGHADQYPYFRAEVKTQINESGRPEIFYETKDFIVVIFGLESSMKEFRYNKNTGFYTIKILRKLEDSTKSQFHKEPHERLKETIKEYQQ
jgi:hypothetical protein